LPRNFDEESDIDILVVFNYSEYTYTPETYRNQLKRFAESRYSTSKVLKSHPSIVLEMNKIKFDLVPSRITGNYFYTTYQIPDKNGYWQNTDPKGFNEELTRVNTQYNYIVKPLIRVFKRWNSYNDYPYSSYELFLIKLIDQAVHSSSEPRLSIVANFCPLGCHSHATTAVLCCWS
jgi:hypothetical protein